MHFLCVSAYPKQPIQKVIDDITGILKRQNGIAPDDKQAVLVINLAAQFRMFDMLFGGIDALVWLVGLERCIIKAPSLMEACSTRQKKVLLQHSSSIA